MGLKKRQRRRWRPKRFLTGIHTEWSNVDEFFSFVFSLISFHWEFFVCINIIITIFTLIRDAHRDKLRKKIGVNGWLWGKSCTVVGKAIDYSSMTSIAHWCHRWVIDAFDYFRLSNDYPSITHWLHAHTISSNFFLNLFPVIKIYIMVFDDNINSQIGIALSTRKPMCIGHD